MKKLPFIFFNVFLGLTSTGNAQEMQEFLKMSLEELMDVSIVTASKHQESISDTPTTVIVITQEQIHERGYVNVVDLLQDLPGVELTRHSRSSAYHNLVWRGRTGNNKFLLLQDGLRIDAPGGGVIAVADNFPLHYVKQVEILYGPAAALYGADAFAGVINLITVPGAELNNLKLSVERGSFNEERYQLRGGIKLSEELSLAVSAHQHSSDTADLSAYYPADFPQVDAVTFDKRVIVPAAEREEYTAPIRSSSLFARLDYGKYVTLGFTHSFFRSLTSTGDRPDTSLYRDDAQWNTVIDNLYGKFRFDVNEDLSGELTLNYATHENDPNSKYINIYTGFKDNGYQYAENRVYSIEQQLNYRMSEAHNLTGGLSYADYYSLQTPDMPEPFNRNKPLDEQEMYYEGTNLPLQFTESNYTNTAAYLQWQARWNERLATTVGIRYDDNSRYDSDFNPRLGLVYQYSESTVFKILYGESFRAPSPDETLDTFGSFSGKRNDKGEYIGENFRVPNFNLQPEQSRDLETSLSQALTADLDLTVNAFYVKTDNLIVTQNEAIPTQFIPGAELRNTTIKGNAGGATYYGGELLFNYRAKLGKSWKTKLWGSYNYLDGSIAEQDNAPEGELAYIAPHKFKLGATFSYLGKYFFTPKLYAVDQTNTGRVDKKNPTHRLTSPGYALLGLRLGANHFLMKNLFLTLDITNVFDIRYYGAAGSASTTFQRMPQSPRAFALTLEYRFE